MADPKEEATVAKFVDTDVVVEEITEEMVKVRVGPEGFEWSRSELEELANGSNASEMLRLNVAIAMKLGGADFKNAVALKNVIEARQFKYWR